MTSVFLVLVVKQKVVASSREVIHALLRFRFSVAVESAVLSTEVLSVWPHIDLCVCFESSAG